MLRLEVTSENAVISTGYHKHVFAAFNANQGGYSRPYLYTRKVIEIALQNNCKNDIGAYSYQKLLDVLKQKKESHEYDVVTYYGWWLFNIFQPLYHIGENDAETFITFEEYLHNVARSTIILGEKNEDMTNKQFVDKIIENERLYMNEMDELVIFHKISDEKQLEQELDAINQNSLNNDSEN